MKPILSSAKWIIGLVLTVFALLPLLRTFEFIDRPISNLTNEWKRHDRALEKQSEVEWQAKLNSLSPQERAKFLAEHEKKKNRMNSILRGGFLIIALILFYFKVLKPLLGYLRQRH